MSSCRNVLLRVVLVFAVCMGMVHQTSSFVGGGKNPPSRFRIERLDGSTTSGPAIGMPALHGEAAIDHLKQDGSYESLAEAMAMARYSVNWVDHPRMKNWGGAYESHNTAHGFTTYFTPEAIHLVQGVEGNPEWSLEMKLRGIGYGNQQADISPGIPSVQTNRIELERSSSLTEWYVNGPEGLEQGLTLPAAPGERSEGEWVRLSFGLESSLEAQLTDGGQAIDFLDWRGERVLRYDRLVVTDAQGQPLPSRMDLARSQIRLEFDDREAVYPVTVDPTFSQQQQLTASDGAANDLFGLSVAISGETAVIGAIGDAVGANASQGSVYVFVRSGMTWSQQQKLTSSDGAASDFFGRSVAIDGDTVVVGASQHDVGANSNQGSVYIFVRSGTTWTQQQKLMASDGAANDFFGQSVAIHSNTVVVSANQDDVGANGDQGSAYVFVRNGTIWTQQQQLTATGGVANDQFGRSVAISGDTVVVGAFQVDVSGRVDQGSAYVFVRSGTIWTQQQQLTASDGAATDLFGTTVAINGETVVVGAPQADVSGRNNQGSAYVYVRTGTTWNQQQKLTASDGTTNDDFGRSVAISGDTVVVGSRLDDVGGNSNQGSAYVFVRTGSVWTQQQQVTASGGAANDQFGASVAISGETLVVGASQDDVGANTDQGSAYVFACTSAQIWVQQSNLTAPDGAVDDRFGTSVAISGETVAVGAPEDDITLFGEGSVYVFVRTGTTWSLQQKLTIPGGQLNELFGTSVAISGETLVAGAVLSDVGGNSDQGAAYVFERIGTTWTQKQQLTATGGATNDQFGQSVAINGQTLVVGAPLDDVGGNTDQGSATVFVRSGTTWTQQQQLTATGGAANDRFGSSVAISGETAVVGAPLREVSGNVDQGAAYVFVRSGTTWTQQQQLTVSDGATIDQFGSSVAISGETAVVGAPLDDVGANTDQGSAYVFVRNGTSWTQKQQLTAANGAVQDQFGYSVAVVNGGNVVVGAFIDDVGANGNQGSASVYRLDCVTCPTITGTVSGGGSICSGSNSTVTVTISGGTPPYTNVAVNGATAQNGTSGQTVFNFTVNPAVTTVYTLQSGSDSIGCPVAGSGSATVTVNQLPTTANAGPDQMLLCTSSPTTTLAANTPGIGSGQWSVVTAPAGGSTNSTQFSNTGSPTTAFTPNPGKIGTYILQWTITNSFCTPSTDTVAIIYEDPPPTANAGPDQTLCTSSPTATLAANTPGVGSGQWSVVTAPAGGSTNSNQFSNTGSPTATFTPSPAVAGTYTLQWAITNSFCTPSTDTVAILYKGPPTTANAGPDRTLCTSSPTVTLTAGALTVGSGQWSVVTAPAGGSTAPTQFDNVNFRSVTFTPNPVVAGNYTLRWTVSNPPCSVSTDDVVLQYISTVVTNGNNSGAGSLRDTIANACIGSTITFQAGVTAVTLTTASLVIDKNLTINGGTGVTVTRASGSPVFRIFTINSGRTVTLSALTISNGATTSGQSGGGILNNGTLTLTGVIITGNSAGQAGGIGNNGNLTANQCSITNNTATNDSGIGTTSGTVMLNNCTISGNSANGQTTALRNQDAAVTLTNCTLSGTGTGLLNLATSGRSASITLVNSTVSGGSVSTFAFSGAGSTPIILKNTILNNASPTLSKAGPTASVVSQGNNLASDNGGGFLTGSGDQININPLLASLGNYGGSTQTFALLPGSPAINAGNNTGAPATDQRGISRPQQSTVDIGAFESQGFTVSVAGGNNQSTPPNTSFANPLGVTITSIAGEPVNGGLVTFTPPGSGPGCTLAGNPATISSGTATSGTVTADGTPGGPYNVAASARGASPINFSLSNICSTITGTVSGGGTICTGSSSTVTVTMTGGAPPYSVTLNNGGGTQTGSSPFTFDVSPGSSTTYSVMSGMDSAGCSITGSGSATVTVNLPPTPANAGSDQTICVSSPAVTLAGNAPTAGNGQWSVISAPVGGSTAATQFNNRNLPTATFTPSPVRAGNYTLRWTISNSPCTASTDEVTMTYNAAPTAANAGPNQARCLTSPAATMAANTPTDGSGQWSVVAIPPGGSTDSNQFSNTSLPTAIFLPSPAVAGTYTLRWTITNLPCTPSFADMTVTFSLSPTTASVGGAQSICPNGTTTGLGGNTPAVGTGRWTVVSGGSGTFSPNTTTPNASFTHTGGAGPITLRWTISNPPCLDATAEVVITINSGPTVNAGPDQLICRDNPTVTLAAVPGGTAVSGMWTGGLGTFSPGNTDPNATYTPTAGEIAAGTVTLTFTTDTVGGLCPSVSDDMTITIDSCLGVMVADTTNNRIQRFDGNTWSVVGVGTVGNGNGQFRLPEAVTSSPDGQNIYVADTGNNRIQWSTDSGTTWANFATIGSGLNQVRAPQGLVLDSAGNLYVSDTGNGRVMRFNGGSPGSGVVIASNGAASGQIGSPRGLVIDGTFRLFVTDESNSRILRISNADTTVSATSGTIIATLGTALNKVKNPQGIAIDGSGTLYVADTGNSRILRWTNANPNNATTLALTGSSLGQVNYPEGVTITQFAIGPLAGSPLLVVGDTANNRIQGRPLPTGGWTLVGAPNGVGTGVGQFRAPSKIQ